MSDKKQKASGPMDDPVRLRAALLAACLIITKGDHNRAMKLYEDLYDTALEKLGAPPES